MWKMHLNGRIPSKKNSRITDRRTGRTFPSKDYTRWHKDATMQLGAFLPIEPIPKCDSVYIELFTSTYRRFDCTNKAESIMDLLVDNNILKDDEWKVTGKVTIEPVKCDEDGARITIYESESI